MPNSIRSNRSSPTLRKLWPKFLFLLCLSLPSVLLARPRNPFPSTPDEVWQNDLDIDQRISVLASSVTTSIALATSSIASSSGDNLGSHVATKTITANFGISASTITVGTVTASALIAASTYTWRGFGILPILQTKLFTTTVSSNTTGTTFVDSTLAVAIAPKTSSSTIFVLISGTAQQGNGADGYITIARNGSNLAGSGGFVGMVSNNNYQVCVPFFDNPGTTSTLTYSAQIRSGGGGIQTFFPDSTASADHTATILLVELGNN